MSQKRAPSSSRPGSPRALFARAIFDVGLFSLLINLLLLVIPLYLLQVYDRVLPSSSVETLVYLSVISVAALGFLGVLDAIPRRLHAAHRGYRQRQAGPDGLRGVARRQHRAVAARRPRLGLRLHPLARRRGAVRLCPSRRCS
ncbi:hypothetical protein ACVOMV_32100 [Mesorhizobium atlanticum]